MVRDLGVRLERYGFENAPDNIRKIALTPDQIRIYNLIPAPVKMSDSRAEGFVAEHGENVYELDALEPPVLEQMVERAITRRIDSEMWNATQQLIETERTDMMPRFARMGRAIREL